VEPAAPLSGFIEAIARFRTKAVRVLGHERRIAWIVHGSNALAICAMVSSDMLSLRSFMIGASAMAIVYNLLQPIPLIPPAAWMSCCHFCFASAGAPAPPAQCHGILSPPCRS
jgi:hypothetical protein